MSSVEVTQAFIERIESVNEQLNAVVQFNPERALELARKADEDIARRSDDELKPLHGLPITLKDTIDTIDFPNTYGSHLYDNYQSSVDGTCVKRLKEAGGIVLGLTNVPELLSAYESDNLIYGKTNNPYDSTLSAGGSSGGESAIIAANGSPLGLGTDGGGSIRIPAHYCGIAGIKPTQGLVPVTGINLPFSGAGCLQGFGTAGPMAKTVRDLQLGLSVMAGADGIDPNVPPITLQSYEEVDVSGLKVTYFTDNGICTPTVEIQNAVTDAVSLLADAGAQIEEAKPAGIEKTFELHWETFFTQCDGGRSAHVIFDELEEKSISPIRRQFNRDAKHCDLSTFELNQRFIEVSQFKWSVYQFLNKYDVIICPPCASLAKPHGKCLDEVKDFTYTMSFNNSGSPAVVVPFSKSSQGLPIGIQIVSNLWMDHVALAVADFIEKQRVTTFLYN